MPNAKNSLVFTSMRFADIPGHNELKSRLINSKREGRIGHAMLFSGEEGSSALSMSIAFAQYMCCENPGESDSCGRCSSCIKFQKLAHPDLHFYFPTTTSSKAPKNPLSQHYYEEWRIYLQEQTFPTHSSWLRKMNPDRKDAIISTGESAQIIQDLSLKSFESEARFAIIWLPEKFNTHSSNRLLKIIEEPPENVYFFLITENPERVLPTIVSRTQIIRIGHLEENEMEHWLRAKQSSLTNGELSTIIKASEGNPLKALKALEGDLNDSDLSEYFIQWARLCYKAYEKMPELISRSEDIASRSREEQNQLLNFGINFFRNGILKNHQSEGLAYITDDEKKHVANFASLLNMENAPQLIKSFEQAMGELDRYVNAKILFLDLSLIFAQNINPKNVHL